jgi:hypothetical protein
LFLFIGHEVLFFETPFFTALEETKSVARPHWRDRIGATALAVVSGHVLNFGTQALFLFDMKFCFMKRLFPR